MSIFTCLRASFVAHRRFRTYVPSPVTFGATWRWLRQFKSENRQALAKVLDSMVYFDEQAAVKALVEGNRKIVAKLAEDGIGYEQLIYMQHDAAGSSSAMMLHLLRDAAQLQLRGATLLDSRSKDAISEQTKRISSGAIIYVDDFAGTGRQLLDSRAQVTPYVAGSFSEFFLSVAICEEAEIEMQLDSVVPVAQMVHREIDRPFSDKSSVLSASERASILSSSRDIFGEDSLGFGRLASNVVLYRNAPDSTPRILRGSQGQKPYQGIFPRTTDLAVY